MKIRMRPIRVTSWSDEEGKVTPMRFEVAKKSGNIVKVRVEEILEQYETRTSGQLTRNYLCRTEVDDTSVQYELAFELSTIRWYLSKW